MGRCSSSSLLVGSLRKHGYVGVADLPTHHLIDSPISGRSQKKRTPYRGHPDKKEAPDGVDFGDGIDHSVDGNAEEEGGDYGYGYGYGGGDGGGSRGGATAIGNGRKGRSSGRGSEGDSGRRGDGRNEGGRRGDGKGGGGDGTLGRNRRWSAIKTTPQKGGSGRGGVGSGSGGGDGTPKRKTTYAERRRGNRRSSFAQLPEGHVMRLGERREKEREVGRNKKEEEALGNEGNSEGNSAEDPKNDNDGDSNTTGQRDDTGSNGNIDGNSKTNFSNSRIANNGGSGSKDRSNSSNANNVYTYNASNAITTSNGTDDDESTDGTTRRALSKGHGQNISETNKDHGLLAHALDETDSWDEYHHDETDAPYWVHRLTRVSSWVRPPAGPASAESVAISGHDESSGNDAGGGNPDVIATAQRVRSSSIDTDSVLGARARFRVRPPGAIPGALVPGMMYEPRGGDFTPTPAKDEAAPKALTGQDSFRFPVPNTNNQHRSGWNTTLKATHVAQPVSRWAMVRSASINDMVANRVHVETGARPEAVVENYGDDHWDDDLHVWGSDDDADEVDVERRGARARRRQRRNGDDGGNEGGDDSGHGDDDDSDDDDAVRRAAAMSGGNSAKIRELHSEAPLRADLARNTKQTAQQPFLGSASDDATDNSDGDESDDGLQDNLADWRRRRTMLIGVENQNLIANMAQAAEAVVAENRAVKKWKGGSRIAKDEDENNSDFSDTDDDDDGAGDAPAPKRSLRSLRGVARGLIAGKRIAASFYNKEWDDDGAVATTPIIASSKGGLSSSHGYDSWDEYHHDETDAPYWVHRLTRVSSWERPPAGPASAESVAVSAALHESPGGQQSGHDDSWDEYHHDEMDAPYWVHRLTRVSSWERPREGPASVAESVTVSAAPFDSPVSLEVAIRDGADSQRKSFASPDKSFNSFQSEDSGVGLQLSPAMVASPRSAGARYFEDGGGSDSDSDIGFGLLRRVGDKEEAGGDDAAAVSIPDAAGTAIDDEVAEVAAVDEGSDDELVWEEHFDNDSQTPYFINRVTGESTWERPAGGEDAEVAAEEAVDADEQQVDHRARLVAFYTEHKPDEPPNQSTITAVLDKYQGKEDELFSYLHQTYRQGS